MLWRKWKLLKGSVLILSQTVKSTSPFPEKLIWRPNVIATKRMCETETKKHITWFVRLYHFFGCRKGLFLSVFVLVHENCISSSLHNSNAVTFRTLPLLDDHNKMQFTWIFFSEVLSISKYVYASDAFCREWRTDIWKMLWWAWQLAPSFVQGNIYYDLKSILVLFLSR